MYPREKRKIKCLFKFVHEHCPVELYIFNLVCHGMVPITFYASVRISTVFAEFALKTSVEISTN